VPDLRPVQYNVCLYCSLLAVTMTDPDILKSQCKVLVNLHFFFSEKVHGIHAEFTQILRRIFNFWHRILASPVVCYMDFLQLLCCLAFVGTSQRHSTVKPGAYSFGPVRLVARMKIPPHITTKSNVPQKFYLIHKISHSFQ